ncbi:hypothetical protein N9137_00920 [Pseudomonadales bacterium]|nr:hypothetical protein [Pseudomonadales bacterium]
MTKTRIQLGDENDVVKFSIEIIEVYVPYTITGMGTYERSKLSTRVTIERIGEKQVFNTTRHIYGCHVDRPIAHHSNMLVSQDDIQFGVNSAIVKHLKENKLGDIMTGRITPYRYPDTRWPEQWPHKYMENGQYKITGVIKSK